MALPVRYNTGESLLDDLEEGKIVDDEYHYKREETKEDSNEFDGDLSEDDSFLTDLKNEIDVENQQWDFY